jgi:hypothetical protein
MGLSAWISKAVTAWLTHEPYPPRSYLCDFDLLSKEIRPCDILLVEGRSRISRVIRNITVSAWTHSAMYLGRLRDITDAEIRARVRAAYPGSEDDQLILEALLGEGTVVKPLSKYAREHMRICRPKGLTPDDALTVIRQCVRHLGDEYNFRQLLDLARFLLPYSFIPKRWRSTLFEHNVGDETRTVCSSMIAAAFASVQYPILPVVHRAEDGGMRLYRRNHKLFTPNDFDTSPYFDIVKYSMLAGDDLAVYRQLPWDRNGVICDDENYCYIPPTAATPKIVVRHPKQKSTEPQIKRPA